MYKRYKETQWNEPPPPNQDISACQGVVSGVTQDIKQ